MWQPISTAPPAGEFLVRGGTYESKLSEPRPLVGVAHVLRCGDDYDVCNTCYYGVWVSNPTEWHPLP